MMDNPDAITEMDNGQPEREPLIDPFSKETQTSSDDVPTPPSKETQTSPDDILPIPVQTETPDPRQQFQTRHIQMMGLGKIIYFLSFWAESFRRRDRLWSSF